MDKIEEDGQKGKWSEEQRKYEKEEFHLCVKEWKLNKKTARDQEKKTEEGNREKS